MTNRVLPEVLHKTSSDATNGEGVVSIYYINITLYSDLEEDGRLDSLGLSEILLGRALLFSARNLTTLQFPSG